MGTEEKITSGAVIGRQPQVTRSMLCGPSAVMRLGLSSSLLPVVCWLRREREIKRVRKKAGQNVSKPN